MTCIVNKNWNRNIWELFFDVPESRLDLFRISDIAFERNKIFMSDINFSSGKSDYLRIKITQSTDIRLWSSPGIHASLGTGVFHGLKFVLILVRSEFILVVESLIDDKYPVSTLRSFDFNSSRTSPRPIPAEAPVTTASVPANFSIFSLIWVYWYNAAHALLVSTTAKNIKKWPQNRTNENFFPKIFL